MYQNLYVCILCGIVQILLKICTAAITTTARPPLPTTITAANCRHNTTTKGLKTSQTCRPPQWDWAHKQDRIMFATYVIASAVEVISHLLLNAPPSSPISTTSSFLASSLSLKQMWPPPGAIKCYPYSHNQTISEMKLHSF